MWRPGSKYSEVVGDGRRMTAPLLLNWLIHFMKEGINRDPHDLLIGVWCEGDVILTGKSPALMNEFEHGNLLAAEDAEKCMVEHESK